MPRLRPRRLESLTGLRRASLRLAHERSCEAELANVLAEDLAQRRLPDLDALWARFAPNPARLPEVSVQLAPLAEYEALIDSRAGVVA